jgi:hypothetical protein
MQGPAPTVPTPDKPRRASTQDDLGKMTHKPQAVPINLSNDVASKERREEALRARGLLPPRQRRDLSAIEADADRRIDELQKTRPSFSFPPRDEKQSEANNIAHSWRTSNSKWLLQDPPNSDTPVVPMIEGPQA